MEQLAERVHPTFGLYFSIALFLTLGPIYVILRTTSVVFEIGITPLIPETMSLSVLLFVFSFIFIVLTVIKVGIITVVGLALLQISMAWIGASSVDAIGQSENGGKVLANSAVHLFGYGGIFILGTVILITGITTNIACLSSVAEYFERVFPKVDYKEWLYILAAVSLGIMNFGLSKINDRVYLCKDKKTSSERI